MIKQKNKIKIIALKSESIVDKTNPSIGYIDEIIDAGIVGLNAAEFLANY